MNEEKVKAAFDAYMRENHDDDYTRMYSAEAIDNMYCDFSNGFEAACKRSPWPEIKESVTEAAREMCEAWGMEDNHGYSVKDTFQVGFVQGSNWRAVQSPWISVKERLPEVGICVLVRTTNMKYIMTSMYIPKDCKGNVLGEKEWKGSGIFKGSITHWMEIPKV